MIEITVKTLDSQNHSFSVPDDATVKQFKEKIHETLPIPIESQRLIYCGRVLQDDKNLSDYDVNGKVVHLVQRAPPQSSPPPSSGAGASNGTNARAGNWARRGSTRRTAFRSRLDGGNAMYLGAMAIPADVMDASGITTPPPSQSLSRSRLATARRMIRGAVMLLDLLDGPPSTDPATPPEEPGSSESNGEPADPAEPAVASQESEDPPSQPLLGESMSEFSQAATAAVIASAFSAARTSGVPSHMTISRRSRGREEVSLSVDVDSQGNITHVSGENGESTSGDAGAEGDSPPPEVAAGQDEAGPSRTAGARRGRDYHTRTPALADVMEELAQVNLRLQPYLQRYQELVRTDPDFGTDANEATVANRLYYKVSQVMHNLSHAYHALSDIMCDFTQPPPRNLRCRPVLIQHSAVLQAGIPISAQINVMTNRGTSTMPAPMAASTPSDSNSPEPTRQAEPMETPSVPQSVLEGLEIDSSFVSGVVLELQTQERERPAPPTTATTAAPTTEAGGAQSRPSANTQPNVSMSGLPSSFSLSPGNVEFFMEVGPGSITIDSVEATLLPSSNGGGTGTVEAGVIGNMPWGSSPPPEFIQNLMQAVAGHMIRGNMGAQEPSAPPAQPATTASQSQGSTTSSSASPNAANAAGQNSQARGNTATHPTTSTQTRSTSRPHVHLASPMGGFSTGAFDQFLPCNSHHVRTLRRRGPMHVYQRFEPENVEADRGSRESRSRSTQPSNQTSTSPSDDNPIAQLFSGIMGSLQAPASGSQSQSQPARSTVTNPSAAQRLQNENVANMIRGLMDNLTGPGGRHEGVAMAIPSVNFPLGLMSQILERVDRPVLEGNTLTLADFMQSYYTDVGDRSYVEGESLLADLVMLMAHNLTLQDVMSLSAGQGAPLDGVRPQLREFVEQRILQGGHPSSAQDVSRGIERLNSEFRPYLDVVLQARLREDIDLILTVNRFNQVRFAELIKLVTSDGGAFGGRLMMWFKLYMQDMFTILLHCCNDDIQQLDGITRSSVRQLTSGLTPAVQEWTISSSVAHMRTYMASLNVPVSDVQSFLVYRAPQAVPEPPVVPAASPVVAIPVTPAEEPMEMDSPPAVEPFAPSDNTEEPIPIASLPAEPWHAAVPGEWVPIITRDVQRQRKQSSQAPFSDAYLSGMPSKRRKVVTSAKPTGNLTQVISDGVRHAVNAVGASAPNSATVESVAQLVSTDPNIQRAYRSQVCSTISDNLANNSDFTAEKFPNTDKFFTKK